MGFLFYNFKFIAIWCWPQPFSDPAGTLEGRGYFELPTEKNKLELYKCVEVLVICVFLSRDSIVLIKNTIQNLTSSAFFFPPLKLLIITY